MQVEGHGERWVLAGVLTLGVILGGVGSGWAQVIKGLTDDPNAGKDGPYDLTGTPSGTTVEFDPAAFGAPADNVFRFTTVVIPSGVRVRLTSKRLNGPVYWLAREAVQIAGTVDLNGGSGHSLTGLAADRFPSVPGPGGFGGGVGTGRVSGAGAYPGNGPGGGGTCHGGTFSGSSFLVPLIGGSGGGGNESGGAAGGGAILIASAVSIAVSGRIEANGGSSPGCCEAGGGGSGGAIRLVAPIVSGGGALSVANGTGRANCCACNGAGSGRVRLEAFQNQFNGPINGSLSRSSPFDVFVPTAPAPSVRVVSIAGQAVPVSPNGLFTVPDVSIGTSPAAVVVEASGVPQGTRVTLHLFSENGNDQSPFPTVTLTTCDAQGMCQGTGDVSFPTGFTRGFPRAVWREGQ